jgi:hypothetical protein
MLLKSFSFHVLDDHVIIAEFDARRKMERVQRSKRVVGGDFVTANIFYKK